MGKGGLSEVGLARMHQVMARHSQSGYIPGVVTLVSRGDDVVADAIGTKAFDSAEPMTRDTIFRIASISKPITAVAAMILVEECVLRLDDPVDGLLPELANRQVLRHIDSELDDTAPAHRPITLRDLLTFRLGYGAVMVFPSRYPIQTAMEQVGLSTGPLRPTLTPDELMEAFGRLPLLHQPGEAWHYHSGTDILSVLIARASGMSLGEFLHERIFAPLGMKDTGFMVPAEKLDRLPPLYMEDVATGKLTVIDGVENSQFAVAPLFEWGSGGLVSTADDLLVFGQMMLNNGAYGDARILSRPSVDVMTTDQITPEQKARSAFAPGFWDNHGWGFGMAIITKRDDLANTPGRFGWDGGYGTQWYVDPTEKLIGIMLTQRIVTSPSAPPTYRDFWTATYSALDD